MHEKRKNKKQKSPTSTAGLSTKREAKRSGGTQGIEQFREFLGTTGLRERSERLERGVNLQPVIFRNDTPVLTTGTTPMLLTKALRKQDAAATTGVNELPE